MLICGLIATGLFIGGVVQKLSTRDDTSTSSSTSSTAQSSTSDTAKTSSFTKDQIATHSTKDDCWLIIDGSVYDVSDYLSEHPGGVSIVSPFCGKDSTQAFATMDGRGSHSSSADKIKQRYLIGTVSN